MKEIIRRLKMRKSASQKKSRSVDPIKAYKARIEVRIYTWLLDLVIEELEAEQAAKAEVRTETVVTETVATERKPHADSCGYAQIGVQAA